MSEVLRKIIQSFKGFTVVWPVMNGQSPSNNADYYPLQLVDLPEAAAFTFEFIPVPEEMKDRIDETIGYDDESTIKIHLGFRDASFTLTDADLKNLLPQVWNFVTHEVFIRNTPHMLIEMEIRRRIRDGVELTTYAENVSEWEKVARKLRRHLGDEAVNAVIFRPDRSVVFYPSIGRRRLFG